MQKRKFHYTVLHFLPYMHVSTVLLKRILPIQIWMLSIFFMINGSAYTQSNEVNNSKFQVSKRGTPLDTSILPIRSTLERNSQGFKLNKVKMDNNILSKWIPSFKRNKPFKTNEYLSEMAVKNRSSSLKIAGNLSYSTDYYSAIDTPYSGKGVYQYTAQTRLGVVYKNLYPFGVSITNRSSNSGNFPNLLAINIQFEQQKFIQILKERLKQQVNENLDTIANYNSLQKLLGEEKMELERLTNWLNSPAIQQKIVEMKEAALIEARNKKNHKTQIIKANTYDSSELIAKSGLSTLSTNSPGLFKHDNKSNLPTSLVIDESLTDTLITKAERKAKRRTDSLSNRMTNSREADALLGIGESSEVRINPTKVDILKGRNRVKKLSNDSVMISKKKVSTFNEEYQSKLMKIDTLQKSITKMEKLYAQHKQLQNRYSTEEKLAIDQMKSTAQLRKKMKKLGIADSVMPRGYHHLFALSALGIGRNMVSFSALTARNTSVTGIQIEYNPNYYLAFASGVVDYQFTDFWVGKKSFKKQQLNIMRAGYGLKAENHFYVSCFWGQRQIYRPSITSNTDFPNSKLFGYAFEAQWQIGKQSLFTAEFAKSSFQNMVSAPAKSGMIANSFNFGFRSNEAYHVQFSTLATSIQTKVVASFKHVGSDFQSFSVFSSGVKQSIWSINAEQPLFHKQLMMNATLQTNDVTNPNTINPLKNFSLLASMQTTLRIKNWPIMSVGYFPSSQTSYLGGKPFSSNQFYTLFANVTHHYKVKRQLMNTTFLFNRFYNKSDDSGFIFSDSRSIQINQVVFLRKITCQGLFSATKSNINYYYTVENTLQYQWKNWLALGGGIKYNRQPKKQQNLWGYSATTTVTIPKIGQFQFFTEKGFLPNSQEQLTPFNTGKFSFLKSF